MTLDGLHERIKTVRKSLTPKASQTVFAEMLGTKRDTIANYEGGRVVPTDTFIQLLCAKFNISEEWLRTGKGDMRQESETAMFSSFAREYNLSEKEQHVARYLLSLSSEERQQILRYLDGIARAMNADEDAAASVTDSAANPQRTAPMTNKDIDAEVAAFRAALVAEKEGASVSSSIDAERRA